MENHSFQSKSIAVIFNDAKMLLNFRRDLIADLVHHGFDVFCLCPAYQETELLALSSLGVECHEFYLKRNSTNPLDDIKSLISLTKLLRQIKPAVLLAITAKPIVWGLLASRFVGIPHRFALLTGLGYVFTSSTGIRVKILRAILVTLYKIALPLADKIIFQNQDDCQEITHCCHLDHQKVMVIQGTGVNLQEWPYHSPPLYPLTFTLAARLLKEKGILEFCAAASRIKQSHPEVRFWLLGGLDTNPGALSKEEIEKYTQIVEWFGFVNVKDYLAKTSVFVLPSFYREGVPRSIQEALAMGRPIITTDVPGCRETVKDGYNGFLVPPRDVEALVAAIQRFIDSPDLIPKMGLNSRQMAVDLFDVKKINAQYIDLFCTCLM